MKTERCFFLSWFTCLAVLCTFIHVAPTWGQKPPPPVNPQAPTINPLLPAGVQRGVPTVVLVTGTNLANPTGISVGTLAKYTIATGDKKKIDAGKFSVTIDVPANTPVGAYPLRMATLKGASNLRVLCVDDLPQVVSKAGNRTKATAEVIPIPSAVTGAVAAQQSDFYKFTVKAGQRLSFDCVARRIGSAIDAQMTIYDAKSMRELVYDNDSPGCQTDPRITYTFKEAGDYLVEINDVLQRGGAEFFYRLRVGDFPIATTSFPLAARRGTKAKIGFAGPAVEGVPTVDVDVPSDPAVDYFWVAPKNAAGLHGWPVPVAISDADEAVEQEPNDDPKQATRITVPGGVSGRFQKSDDVDHFVFAVKKGQKLAIVAHTLEMYSPSLVYLILRNSKTNAEVAKSNPQAPAPNDQKIDFTAPVDGDYVLEVQHLYFGGGKNESYRISILPPASRFDVVLAKERFDVSPMGVAAIPIQIIRKGYTGPVEISTHGQPGLTGTITIGPGKTAGLLLVAAQGDLAMGAYQFHILGKAVIDGKKAVEIGAARAQVSQAMNALPYPPMHLQNFVALAVKEKSEFNLTVKIDPPQAVPGGNVTITVTANRKPGFDDEIVLNAFTGLPPTVPAPKKLASIPAGKNVVSFPLAISPKTPQGEFFVFAAGKSKAKVKGGKEFTSGGGLPLILVIGPPFDLKIEPAVISLKPGAKAKLKVTAIRKGGYTGPIALNLRKLPALVTAGQAVIAAKQDSTEIEITAAPNAAPANVTTVDVAGTATALNNLANASPMFTVQVQKK
ncbi:MAG: PPC domain-containing protein [Planctomycetes bacterium]|nr:PPC domain-containing protein [Planctomycetota bacterium]